MKIELYSPTIRRKEMSAVLTTMVEEKIGPGDQAKFLIQTAREKLNFDYCLALRSPVMALHLALRSLNLEKGQGVLISALSPLYYTRVIEDLGLNTLYSDVISNAPVLNRESVQKALAPEGEKRDAGCVIFHHSLGYVCDGAGLDELGIPVIEDCSQSYSTVSGEGSDSIPWNGALFTILGLEERDMLTSGGGALLYSMNRRGAAILRDMEDLPVEYGLPDMNAALAVIQFREAEKNLSKRREIANLYIQSVMRTRHRRFIQHGAEYNNYAFPLILESGVKAVKAYARKKEIAVESAFENTPVGCGMVPPEKYQEAYSLSLRTVLFPLYPKLGMTDVEKVAKLILTLP
jgi:dTDP-4-amino-4,6-dideoxygalactose transaminase